MRQRGRGLTGVGEGDGGADREGQKHTQKDDSDPVFSCVRKVSFFSPKGACRLSERKRDIDEVPTRRV